MKKKGGGGRSPSSGPAAAPANIFLFAASTASIDCKNVRKNKSRVCLSSRKMINVCRNTPKTSRQQQQQLKKLYCILSPTYMYNVAGKNKVFDCLCRRLLHHSIVSSSLLFFVSWIYYFGNVITIFPLFIFFFFRFNRISEIKMRGGWLSRAIDFCRIQGKMSLPPQSNEVDRCWAFVVESLFLFFFIGHPTSPPSLLQIRWRKRSLPPLTIGSISVIQFTFSHVIFFEFLRRL